MTCAPTDPHMTHGIGIVAGGGRFHQATSSDYAPSAFSCSSVFASFASGL